MERNSRDFQPRIRAINENAEAVCDFLHSRSLAAATSATASTATNNDEAKTRSPPVIKQVFHPKFVTREHFERCRIPGGGYGGLFSLPFTSPLASRVFFDSLSCFKGPSLGTNFTLACPYTVLAHYTELGWAGGWGVEEGLVRVSVGMEERGRVVETFRVAVERAEEAVRIVAEGEGGEVLKN